VAGKLVEQLECSQIHCPTRQLLQGPAAEMLFAAAEAVGPQLIASLLHQRAAAHKNPKVCRCSIEHLSLLLLQYEAAYLRGNSHGLWDDFDRPTSL